VSEIVADDGVRIVYDDHAPAPAGGPAGAADLPPVVLHHGFAVDAHGNWGATGVVDALVAAGRRVVALDARGHGRSGAPHDPASYGEARMARDLRQLIDALGVPEVDLVGYSMGAVVALVLATDEPRVRRLVVGGVGAGIVEQGGVDRRVLDNTALAEALLAEDPATIADPESAGFRAFADAQGADRRALAAHAQVVHDTPIPIERIAAPTLVIVGEADPLAARPEVLAGPIPDCTLVRVPGDHVMAVVAPAFAPTLVAFLAGEDVSAAG
jgi:pimeloyl-ACP methyl ester carboxylesterase